MQEISEQETNELEGHGDHAVPDKGEDGADGEAVDVDLIGGHAGSEDGGFPVWRCRICGGLFVCLEGGSVRNEGRGMSRQDLQAAFLRFVHHALALRTDLQRHRL